MAYTDRNSEKYRDFKGNELGKYASIYTNTDQLQKQLLTVKRTTINY